MYIYHKKMRYMKKAYLLVVFWIVAIGCSSPEEIVVNHRIFTMEGEFLFEGPNTLQYGPGSSLSDLVKTVDIDQAKVKKVTASEVFVTFPGGDSITSEVESLQLQVVSDKLSLKPLATLNPVESGKSIYQLGVTEETDMLEYLQDSTRVYVLDVNIGQDMDKLKASVELEVKIEYNP